MGDVSRLTQRTDFGYEKLKSQPKDCNMDDFTGPNFLKRMQHKTLAFVGDSLGRQQFQSLMCMVSAGKEMPEVEDVGTEYGLTKSVGSTRPPAFLHHFLHKINVLVLNTGHHWNRGKINANKWTMSVGGKPNTNRRIADMGGAKNFTIHSAVKWVDSELPKHKGLKVFLRSISPRHFYNGEWNTGGTCDSTTPGALEVVQEESSDLIAATSPIVPG